MNKARSSMCYQSSEPDVGLPHTELVTLSATFGALPSTYNTGDLGSIPGLGRTPGGPIISWQIDGEKWKR